jgi:hypothetical protein
MLIILASWEYSFWKKAKKKGQLYHHWLMHETKKRISAFKTNLLMSNSLTDEK